MKPFNQIANISPLPVVNLTAEYEPKDGWHLPLTNVCNRHLAEGESCRKFYESLGSPDFSPGIYQCPYGFATIKFVSGGTGMGITGFIPYPRLGGAQEKILAKKFSQYKFAMTELEKMILNMRKTRGNLQAVEEETILNYAMALHEIRKLNRTVVQNAERLCRAESPEIPERANDKLVSIWKAAELMSRQFEIVEILANESIADLPMNTYSEVYRLFDKCVKLFKSLGEDRITISSFPQTYSPRVDVCDKTIPIIPTVLLENAIKYSIPKSIIRVKIEQRGIYCLVSVTSESNKPNLLNDYIFERGVRATSDREGSGNGLYVAQLIALQHHTRIQINSVKIKGGIVKHTFSFLMRTFS